MSAPPPSRTVASCLAPFGTSIFSEMSALAAEHGAINLSQGFPDFDGPAEIRERAAEAIRRGPNQYVPSHGVARLREAIAANTERFRGRPVDPGAEVTVMAGATESLSATLLGLLEPGDEVILLEPCYDLYPPMVARAGATAVYVPLERPGFRLPLDRLAAAFTERTRAILINNPLNPLGVVFTVEELTAIGELCARHDAIAIGDEVYEHIVYGPRRHTSLLEIEALNGRCVVISSTAKTFSMTGWKVGWALAAPPLTAAIRMAHQFLTFCTPGPLQEAMAFALELDDGYYEGLLADYAAKREKLGRALEELGMEVLWPQGTYYLSIDVTPFGRGDDLEFCRALTAEAKVAAIPASFFWGGRRDGRDLARFCFCKTDETLDEGIARLRRWRG